MLHIASSDSFFCIFATNKRQLYLQVPFHLTDAPSSSFFIFLTANWEPNENLSIEILVAVPGLQLAFYSVASGGSKEGSS